MNIQSQQMILNFDTIEEMSQGDNIKPIKSNICYCIKSLKKHPDPGNKFAVGAEMK